MPDQDHDRDILQNRIARLGQSQADRHPPELGAHHADVDERTPLDRMMFAHRFAKGVRFYDGDTGSEAGNWSPFFDYTPARAEEILHADDGSVPAHLALWAAFVRLYELPREAVNRLTGRHRDFFYERVLGFERRPPVADRAHVVLELKRNVAPVRVGPEHRFTAGKDASGAEVLFAPIRETVVGAARVASLRSIHVDGAGRGALRFAPIAPSSDGVGGELPEAEPKWAAFGHDRLPAAEVGFAIASPVLRMAEGRRAVRLTLGVDGLAAGKLTSQNATAGLRAFVSGEKSWIGPLNVSAQLSATSLQLDVVVPEGEQAVVDYDAKRHGQSFRASAPIVQIVLQGGDGALGYGDVRGLDVRDVKVSVDVSGVTSLALEGDAGRMDPKKAFLPFGAQPAVGARFMVGYPEALAKKLSEVKLSLRWQALPDSFPSRYANYGLGTLNASHFTASVSLRDGGSWSLGATGQTLFTPLSSGERTLTLTPSTPSRAPAGGSGMMVHALQRAGTKWAKNAALVLVRQRPIFRSFLTTSAPSPRPGFITLTLERDFKHQTFRTKSVEQALAFSKAKGGTPVVLQEPYTPAVQQIALAYKAHSDTVRIFSEDLAEFANADAQFFLVGPFGTMRDHGYPRRQLPFVKGTSVPLFPRHDHAGELLIGLSGIEPGSSVSLLFQVAEGSADPELPRQEVGWSVLCDNYWRTLGTGELVLDTTRHLLTSGIVSVIVPSEATVENTLLPEGLVWLRATVDGDTRAVSELLEVAANAVEVRRSTPSPADVGASLPAGKLARLKTPLGAVKALRQPYDSFGGVAQESAEGLAARAAERLRHRGRCVTPWDYERLVLGAFPEVHHARCLPHAKPGSWSAPGHLRLLLIPELRHRNAPNPLEPRVDAETLSRIAEYVKARAAAGVTVHVGHPLYQRVQVDFEVRFRHGFEPNFHRALLDRELVQFLSPWAFDVGQSPTFGGVLYRSVLLDFVEARPYVDFVTHFRMFSQTGGAHDFDDVREIRPLAPDALLVSAPHHQVRNADA